jgi:hypothetical protein
LSNIETIKNAIRTHGALGTALNSSDAFYDVNYNSYYQPSSDSGNTTHAVAIVGWDDEKETQAPLSGAWLCKNSWGTSWGEKGYFWISFYDKHCCRHPEMGAVSFQDVQLLAYDHIYYHDYHGWRHKMRSSGAFNAFKAATQKPITAVSFYTTTDNVTYTVKIYDRFEGGQLLDELSVKSGSIQYTGFHTIDLDTPVFLEENDDFYVYLKLSAGGYAYDCSSYIKLLLNQTSIQPPFENDLIEEPVPVEPREVWQGQFRELGKMDIDASSPGVFVESSSSPGQSYFSAGGLWHDLRNKDDTANFCIKALSGEIIPPSPRVISPKDGVCGVNIDIVLKWATGTGADLHEPEYYDLYFGTDFDDVNNADSSWPVGSSVYKGRFPADTNSFDPGGLEFDTWYYWRIDEVNESDPNSPYKGDVCSFTTAESVYYVPYDYPTIQEAIDLSCDGTTIIVAEGTYYENIIIEGKSLTIISTDPNDPNVVAATVIDGNQEGSVVQLSDCEDIIFSGFTIVNGESVYGGGIYCSFSNPVVTNCTFSGNVASFGGGMYEGYSNFTITNCTFSGNSAYLRGGGMYNAYHSSSTVTNCTFNGNSARSDGGGMYNIYSSPTVTNCTFSENSGDGMSNEYGNPVVTNCEFSGNSSYGGGMHNYESSPTLTNCTFNANSRLGMFNEYSNPIVTNCEFSGNSRGGMINEYSNPIVTNCEFSGNSEGYGGMYNEYSNPIVTNCKFSGNSCGGMNSRFSNPILTNCTFSGNSSDARGGGMSNFYSNPILTNCAFSENIAEREGGGMCNYNGCSILTNCTFRGNLALNGNACACDSHHQQSPGNIEMTNCIIWDGGQEIWNNDGSTITISYTDLQNGQAGCFDPYNAIVWGMGNIDADPLFVNAGNDDLHLLPTSPCIDAGDPCYVPAPNETDLDGSARVINSRIDMGAYEADYIEVPMKFTPQALNLSSGGKLLKAHFVLPDDFSVEDVDADTPAVIAPFGVQSYKIKVLLNDEGLVRVEATFRRSDLCSSITSYDDNIEVMVIGRLTSGQYFYGTDIIKITDRAFEHLAVFVSYWLESDCFEPDWCGGADLNADSVVNFIDFAFFANYCFLEGER